MKTLYERYANSKRKRKQQSDFAKELAEYEEAMLKDSMAALNNKSKTKAKKAANKQAMREDGLMTDEELKAKIEKIKNRKERHERRLQEKGRAQAECCRSVESGGTETCHKPPNRCRRCGANKGSDLHRRG